VLPLPPLYFVIPNPDAALPPVPVVVVSPPCPPFARTPVVFDVGAVLLDVLVLVFQFIQTSPPLPPLAPEVAPPAPPDPIDVYTVAPGTNPKLVEIETAPPPPPEAFVVLLVFRPPPPPAPIAMMVFMPDISEGTVQVVVPAVKRTVFVVISAHAKR